MLASERRVASAEVMNPPKESCAYSLVSNKVESKAMNVAKDGKRRDGIHGWMDAKR